MCVHERILFQPRGRRKTRMPWLLYYGCGFERTRLMRCHGINRLDDGFLGVYGKSETLGACSALAALGTLTFGPRVSDFPYTPRTHRLTYIYTMTWWMVLATLCYTNTISKRERASQTIPSTVAEQAPHKQYTRSTRVNVT